MMMYC
jgi:hypothetical protein